MAQKPAQPVIRSFYLYYCGRRNNKTSYIFHCPVSSLHYIFFNLTKQIYKYIFFKDRTKQRFIMTLWTNGSQHQKKVWNLKKILFRLNILLKKWFQYLLHWLLTFCIITCSSSVFIKVPCSSLALFFHSSIYKVWYLCNGNEKQKFLFPIFSISINSFVFCCFPCEHPLNFTKKKLLLIDSPSRENYFHIVLPAILRYVGRKYLRNGETTWIAISDD